LDKRLKILSVCLIGIALLSLNFNFVIASDDDEDGVDDEFEDLNKRNVSIEIEVDKIQIESSLRNGDVKDEIGLKITNDSEGLSIEVSYESEISSGSTPELEFGIIFRKLVEFVDMNDDNLFDPLIDDIIQEFVLNDFQKVKYTQVNITPDTTLHYFVINTTDGVFTAHIYFSEEFYIVNGTLITPVQSKLDIEISEFPYLNSSSQLALYTSLESESDYDDDDETEDEIREYAANEKGVVSEMNNITGIFTWKENATINGISKSVLTSDLDIDDYDGDEQKLYLVYPRGSHIYHDPKIGIAGIYRIGNTFDDPLFLIVLMSIISSLSISIGYAAYHYRERIFPSHYTELKKKKNFPKPLSKMKLASEKLDKLLDNKRILYHLKNLPLDGNLNIDDMKVTALSKDFLKIVNRFDWEEDDLVEFIREMVSLTPEERKSVFNEMMEKSVQQTKDRLDDTKRLYT
jgi:hypothetical protein